MDTLTHRLMMAAASRERAVVTIGNSWEAAGERSLWALDGMTFYDLSGAARTGDWVLGGVIPSEQGTFNISAELDLTPFLDFGAYEFTLSFWHRTITGSTSHNVDIDRSATIVAASGNANFSAVSNQSTTYAEYFTVLEESTGISALRINATARRGFSSGLYRVPLFDDWSATFTPI